MGAKDSPEDTVNSCKVFLCGEGDTNESCTLTVAKSYDHTGLLNLAEQRLEVGIHGETEQDKNA